MKFKQIIKSLTFILCIVFVFSCSAKKVEIKSDGYTQTGKVNKGNRIGDWKYVYDSGELFQKGKYKKNKQHGLWKIYHKNGAVKQIGKFKDGKNTGLWKLYHDNGILYGEGYFNMAKMVGAWKWYFRNGQIHTIRHYENGKLRAVDFAKNHAGKNINKGTIHNGTGSLVIYETQTMKDSIIEKLEYVDGILVD